jgi:hypothetical protein
MRYQRALVVKIQIVGLNYSAIWAAKRYLSEFTNPAPGKRIGLRHAPDAWTLLARPALQHR